MTTSICKIEPNLIPSQLASSIRSVLGEAVQFGRLTPQLVEESAKIIRETRGSGWDWTVHWAAHTYISYVQNFIKAYQTARIWAKNKEKSRTLTVLDLGCGAGASTAGTVLALQEKFNTIIVHGVDTSPDMIGVYRNTFEDWCQSNSCTIKASSEIANAKKYIYSDLHEWDLVVCSYLFCGDKSIHQDGLRKKNSIIIDLPDEGFSRIQILGKRYVLKYDKERSLDVSFLNDLGLGVGPDDWYPVITEGI